MPGPAPAEGRPREWDADVYNRVSGPQEAWAAETLSRLELRGDETLLDAGCGTGRVTEMLIERLPRGRVIGVDGSENMVRKARERLADRAEIRLGDLSELTVDEAVDIVFSNAVFHWILDHNRLFGALHGALLPGGRLIAQCGGSGNIDHVKECIAKVAGQPEIARALAGMPSPWNYAEPDETEARLRAAGFSQARAWLAPRPVTPEEPRDFIRTVILVPYLDHLPAELHDEFIDGILAELGSPVVLDYVRLNMEATK